MSAGEHELHGIEGVQVYPARWKAGDYSLDPKSPRFDAGQVLPNFNDGFTGKAPDIGAFEAGSAPMEFGVKAHLKR